MSGNTHWNNVLDDLEQKIRQLNFECEFKALTVKTIKDNLNDCLDRNILLERELEQERLDQTKVKIKLAALTTNINKSDCVNMKVNDYEYLSNQICKIQIENIELTHELTKSNSQLSQLMENQSAYSEKNNLMTSLFNSLKQQTNQLDKESRVLIKVLCSNKTLAKKILKAFEYNENLNKAQFDQIKYLIKEMTNINSKMHMFINGNEQNSKIMKSNQENTIVSAQEHLEMHRKLINIFEIENDTLHRSLNEILEELTLEDIDKI